MTVLYTLCSKIQKLFTFVLFLHIISLNTEHIWHENDKKADK